MRQHTHTRHGHRHRHREDARTTLHCNAEYSTDHTVVFCLFLQFFSFFLFFSQTNKYTRARRAKEKGIPKNRNQQMHYLCVSFTIVVVVDVFQHEIGYELNCRRRELQERRRWERERESAYKKTSAKIWIPTERDYTGSRCSDICPYRLETCKICKIRWLFWILLCCCWFAYSFEHSRKSMRACACVCPCARARARSLARTHNSLAYDLSGEKRDDCYWYCCCRLSGFTKVFFN